MKTSSLRLLPRAALAFALTCGAPIRVAFAQQPSTADIAQARTLYNQGKELRERGDTAKALEKLKAAHALAGTPLTGLELGRTYMMLGQLLEAREASSR